MPCYDPRDLPYSSETDQFRREVKQLQDRNNWLEAALCAVINTLEEKGIANDILTRASRGGLIDLVTFWNGHSASDEARLAAELHRFSEHEQAIIKKLLNKD